MPVGIALGTAAISAGAGYLGSKSQAKGAKQAAQITTDDNAANRAFATDIYNRNASTLAPWQTSGLTANNAFMELLGYPQAAQPAFAGYGATSAPSAFGGYPMASDGGDTGIYNDFASGMTAFSPLGQRNLAMARANGAGSPGFGGGTFGPPQMSPPGAVTVPAPSARSAFDTYRGSTGYDFRFGEGIRALQSAFSRNLESGASTKAAMRFGQGIASDEFGRYMDLLRGQQGIGLTAANAQAGVATNYANTVTAGNRDAASAAANARLYMGNVGAQNWANIGSSFGNAFGYLAK